MSWLAARGGSLILIAIGALFLVLSLQLPLGSLRAPASGTWPLGVSLVLIVLGLVSIAVPDTTVEALRTTRSELVRVVVAFGAVGVYAAVFWLTGYFVSTVLFVAAVARGYGRASWLSTVVVGVLSGLGVHLLFGIVLELPAP